MTGRASRLTPPGVGGLHVFGLEGPGVSGFLDGHFRPLTRVARSNLRYGHLVDGAEMIDEVLVHLVREGRADISTHGSLAIADRLERLLVEGGFEIVRDWVEEGESRVREEARAALVGAFSAEAARFLARALNGGLEREIAEIAADPRAADAERRLAALVDRAPHGEALTTPPMLVLAGPVNAGKSTLFNRLAREERAIATPEAGTTRDLVEAFVELRGYPFRLVDTAGLRSAMGDVESEGIARAVRARARADLVLEVFPADAETFEFISDERTLSVINKIDRLDEAARAALRARLPRAAPVSASTGEGTEQLLERILARSPFAAPPAPELPCPFTRRQSEVLRAALAALPAEPERAKLALDSLVG